MKEAFFVLEESNVGHAIENVYARRILEATVQREAMVAATNRGSAGQYRT